MSYNPLKRTFICGRTGSGKTTFSSKMYEELHTICVFINTQFEVIPESKSDVIVKNVDEVVQAINAGVKKICYNPQKYEEETAEEIDQIRRMFFKMGLQINVGRKQPVPFAHLFIDEVQDYSSLRQPHKGIDRLWKRGRRFGVVGVAISQRPADVSHTILTQSEYHIIFELGTYEIPYFERYHIPIEEHIEHLQKEYHFVVFDGLTCEEYPPITI